jgi:hypothetical protein
VPATAAGTARAAGRGAGTADPDAARRRTIIAATVGTLVFGIVLVVLAIQLIGGDDGQKVPNSVGPATGDLYDARRRRGRGTATPQALRRGDYTVAVLNGTTITNLARGAANKIEDAGYVAGRVTNDTTNQARDRDRRLLRPRRAPAGARRREADQGQPERRPAARLGSHGAGPRPLGGRGCGRDRERRPGPGAVAGGMVHLARHGQTAYNREGRFQGHLPVPLDETGPSPGPRAGGGRGSPVVGLTVVQPAPARASDRRGGCCAHRARRRARTRAFAETETGDWTDRSFADVHAEDPAGFAAFQATAADFRFLAGSRTPSICCAWRTACATCAGRPARCRRWSSATAARSAGARAEHGDETARGRKIPNAALVAL